MDINGVIFKINGIQTGEGKNGTWQKQEFIIETDEQFPKKVCFQIWGDKTGILKSLKEGDRINVAFNAESREFNGKWYTDLRAWKIDRASKDSPDNEMGDIPEHALPSPDAPPMDDLPF